MAPGEPEQHRLGLVISRVSKQDRGSGNLIGQCFERLTTRITGGRLEAGAGHRHGHSFDVDGVDAKLRALLCRSTRDLGRGWLQTVIDNADRHGSTCHGNSTR
jgi:hypothetical protein